MSFANGVNLWPDGSAIVYPLPDGKGSLYPKTKKKEADKKKSTRLKRLRCAINLMARGKRDTIFFTVTSAGQADSLGKLSLLLNLMRNGYGLTNYVWVRELTKSGLEHFHIAGQFKDGKHSQLFWQGSRKAIQLSDSWAKILGVNSLKNSIRFGWKYRQANGSKYPRATKWYIDEGSAHYMAKYLGKSLLKTGRKVQLSQKLSDVCQPARFSREVKTYSHGKNEFYTCRNKADFIPELLPPDFITNEFLKGYDWKLKTDQTFFVWIGDTKDREKWKFFSDYLRSEN